MMRAIALFFNFLVLILILRMFAPGLASNLITLATNVVAIANEAVEALDMSTVHNSTDDGF